MFRDAVKGFQNCRSRAHVEEWALLYTGQKRSQVIDSEGYRENVGIIVANAGGRVLWCRRAGQDAWQFPQGGIEPEETPEQALYRELDEETGLSASQVVLLGRTRDWLKYDIPKQYIRKDHENACRGQKQIWFMLRLAGEFEPDFHDLMRGSIKPEFEEYAWVDYWRPVSEVIVFKRKVYKQALSELEPLLFRRRARLVAQ